MLETNRCNNRNTKSFFSIACLLLTTANDFFFWPLQECRVRLVGGNNDNLGSRVDLWGQDEFIKIDQNEFERSGVNN